MTEPRTLGELLSVIDPDDHTADVSVADILGEVGMRSFAPVILVPALLLVSPLSAIPGTPTLGAIIITLVALQWVVSRDHLWLPGFVLRRKIAAKKVAVAVTWLRGPAAWIDRHSHRRLRLLTVPPMSMVAKIAIVLIAASWPVLELFPMVTSIGAFAVSLLAFGMMTRDGMYLAIGYAAIGGIAALVSWLTALA